MPSEELDLECPLVDSLLQSFPDLDHDIVNEAVDDLLQTLEQMQAEAAGSDGEDEDDDLLEELIGLDLPDIEQPTLDAEDTGQDNQPRQGSGTMRGAMRCFSVVVQ